MIEDTHLTWWHKDCPERHQAVAAACDGIDEAYTQRHKRNERCLRMYGMNFQIGDSAVDEVYVPARQRLGLNVVRSIVDSAHSDTVQNRPRPMFLTGGDEIVGRWRLQRKARKLEQAVDGIFSTARVYETTSEMVLDSLIFDGAACKVYEEGGCVKVERVLPFEIFVDPQEGLYGKPRTMYQRKFIDRAILRAKFPKKSHRQAIDDAARSYQTGWYINADESDMVSVYEAWRLGDGDKPGKHMIVTNGGTLLEEDWTEEDFPFVFFRWGKLPLGFWADSIANQLTGIQYEINKLMRDIQDAHHLLGKAYISWPDASGAIKPQWNNGIGWILRVRDASRGMPKVEVPQVVSPEIYRHLDRLYQYAYEIVGASQLGAQAKKPAGLDSGKALMVFEDATSRRFLVAGRAYEQVHVDIAHKIVGCLKKIYEKDPEFKIEWSGKKNGRNFLETIPWSEVDMKMDQFRLQVYPTSILPKTPAGRTQTVESWVNMGWIQPEDGMRLMDLPDIEDYQNIQRASWDAITEDLERILDMDPDKPESVDKYQPPMPLYDLALCNRLSHGAFLRAHRDEAPMIVQDQLLRYIRDTKDLMIAAGMLPPEEPPAPPPGGMPPGEPPPGQLPPPPTA